LEIKRRTGVRFCFDSFDEFIKAVGRAPSPEHKLVRWPKTTGDYKAGNLRWLLPNIPAHKQILGVRPKRATQPAQEPAKEIINTTPALPPLTPAFW
jgi:hypothetical protein